MSLVLLVLLAASTNAYTIPKPASIGRTRSGYSTSTMPLRLAKDNDDDLPYKTATKSAGKVLYDDSFKPLESKSPGELQTLRRIDVISKLVKVPFANIRVDGTVNDATEAMSRLSKGSCLVFDNDNKLAGIFTERDFITKVLDKSRPSAQTLITAVMTPSERLIKVSKNLSIKECRQIMLDNNIRHLPVTEENDESKVLGVVSMTDIIRGIQIEELELEEATFVGGTLAEVLEQAKARSNTLALEQESGKQDVLRTGFVVMAATVGALLIQGSWVKDHEWLSMAGTFFLGYVGIIFENYFEFNKAAIALLTATALWVIFADSSATNGITMTETLGDLSEKVSEVSEVVFFILGAMTIVEIVDAHQGFKVVTDAITSKYKRDLMWVIGIITFFMSAILDNLTTTIVMVSLIKKLLPNADDRKIFGAMIVIAANAGGAWTPIGDVTTTMLWINGQITALPTITTLFVPSLVSVVISIFFLNKQIPEGEEVPVKDEKLQTQLAPRGKLVFGTGIMSLLAVPVFKAATGLPPYLGMLASLGVMWSLTDAIHAGEGKDREELMAPAALRKIDTSGVLFFLGILLSVGALDSAGILRSLAQFLDTNIPNQDIVAGLIGLVSAVIDNVPLVAASMGMYSLDTIPADNALWQLIAFCAGTGGSIFVIGSAAGVALMGLEKVDFVWYAKKVSLAAFAGYLGGLGVLVAEQSIFPGVSALGL